LDVLIGGFVVGIFMGMAVAPMRPMASRNIKIVTWIVRLVALAVLIVLFIISIREFYSAADPSKVSVSLILLLHSLTALV
jgi:hypothetical protein